MDRPALSIVMSYHERPVQLRNTLVSFADHDYGEDVEVIIVDDGSTEFPAQEPNFPHRYRIRILYLPPEKKHYSNPCVPFNKGFRAARGDLVVIQNPECLHVDNVVKYTAENLRQGDYLSFSCYSQNETAFRMAGHVTDVQSALKHVDFVDTRADNNGEFGWYNHPKYNPSGYHFCSAITRADLLRLGGFDERYGNGISFDDNEFLYRIRRDLSRFRFVDDIVVLHQWHYTNTEATEWHKRRFRRNEFLFKYMTVGGLPYVVVLVLFQLKQLRRLLRRTFGL